MRPDTSRERGDGNLIVYNADRDERMAADYGGFCETLREALAEDRLPPDEAYWWTRIALAEATLVLEAPTLLDQAA